MPPPHARPAAPCPARPPPFPTAQAVIAFTSLCLEGGDLSSTDREYLRSSLTSGQQLLGVINQILEVRNPPGLGSSPPTPHTTTRLVRLRKGSEQTLLRRVRPPVSASQYAKLESTDPGQGLELNIERFSLMEIISDLVRPTAAPLPTRRAAAAEARPRLGCRPAGLPADRPRPPAPPALSARPPGHAADGHRRPQGDGQGGVPGD